MPFITETVETSAGSLEVYTFICDNCGVKFPAHPWRPAACIASDLRFKIFTDGMELMRERLDWTACGRTCAQVLVLDLFVRLDEQEAWWETVAKSKQ